MSVDDFENGELEGMVRYHDHRTSIAAANAVVLSRRALQMRVLEAFADHGVMTDEELELLPEFAHYGPSTIRKRRSELYQAGLLITLGVRRNSRRRLMLIFGRIA